MGCDVNGQTSDGNTPRMPREEKPALLSVAMSLARCKRTKATGSGPGGTGCVVSGCTLNSPHSGCIDNIIISVQKVGRFAKVPSEGMLP